MLGMNLHQWMSKKASTWLTKDRDARGSPLCDFERVRFEIHHCDVVLVEGRSRVSDVIKNITQSPWTHAALYIGRLVEIEDSEVRAHIEKFYDGDPHQQLIIEALLGEGTIVAPLDKYRPDHLRICRPKGLSLGDAQRVIAYASRHLGCDYDLRQMLDLARFMFPYSVLPRRWRSSLFQHNAGIPTRTVCSSMIAAAFASVRFPVLPVIHRTASGRIRLHRRNFRLFTPSDFDYSPYFDIIKYPYLGFEDLAVYRRLPWIDDADPRTDNDTATAIEQPSGDDRCADAPSMIAATIPAPTRGRRRLNLLASFSTKKERAKRA